MKIYEKFFAVQTCYCAWNFATRRVRSKGKVLCILDALYLMASSHFVLSILHGRKTFVCIKYIFIHNTQKILKYMIYKFCSRIFSLEGDIEPTNYANAVLKPH
jgi:hypothetical protein